MIFDVLGPGWEIFNNYFAGKNFKYHLVTFETAAFTVPVRKFLDFKFQKVYIFFNSYYRHNIYCWFDLQYPEQIHTGCETIFLERKKIIIVNS